MKDQNIKLRNLHVSYALGFLYYESLNRELKTKTIYGWNDDDDSLEDDEDEDKVLEEDNGSGLEVEEEEEQQDPLQEDHVDVTNLLHVLNRRVTPPLPPDC